MRKLSVAAHKIIASLLLIPTVVVLVDTLGNYRWFWPHDRQAMGATMLIGVVWATFFAPSISRVAAYRRMKDRKALREMEKRFGSDPR